MSAAKSPRVSIGLPVYNGENYLEEAIESILAQTFEDFELLIGDNASTDATEEICQRYAVRDPRIRYVRNPENIGAHPNYNRLFEFSSGEYFKWAAHDDVCHPDFLLKCIEVLDRDPSVVLCYPRTRIIDEEGRTIKSEDARPKLASWKPSHRFLEAYRDIPTHPILGVIRADVLRKTPLLGSYPSSDRVLMAELSLYGRFHEVPETLFFKRDHKRRFTRVHNLFRAHQAAVWHDPANAEKIIFPVWRQCAEYFHAINRPSLQWRDRIRCYLAMVGWLTRWRRLAGLLLDLLFAGRWIFRSVR
ncbi:MAG: glycosyltransferase family 2 protein [bacterium]|nr:glycosyltransferase family 2 protein [bacterium]